MYTCSREIYSSHVLDNMTTTGHSGIVNNPSLVITCDEKLV